VPPTLLATADLARSARKHDAFIILRSFPVQEASEEPHSKTILFLWSKISFSVDL
jgi:hypothetical protein